jgi:hypothetical protein
MGERDDLAAIGDVGRSRLGYGVLVIAGFRSTGPRQGTGGVGAVT